MLIISSGFGKSASTLLFLYVEELLQRSGRAAGQKKFREQNREGFINHFTISNTLKLLRLSLFHGDVVVKTHAPPTRLVRLIINLGLARAYYSIRDPRDAILSAFDHAVKAKTKTDKTPSDVYYARFHSRKDFYPQLRRGCGVYRRWARFGKVRFVRYENLLPEPERELKELLDWLGREGAKEHVPAVVAEFAKRKKATLNFNKGALVRFSSELNADEIREIEATLGECIRAMGYELTQLGNLTRAGEPVSGEVSK